MTRFNSPFFIAAMAAMVLSLIAADSSYAQTTIIGGSTGNGDFQAGGGGNPAGDPQKYSSTVNWFNAQGIVPDDDHNFTNSSQMGGSTDPAHSTDQDRRGGMPFQNRTQINDTAYTIGAEGEVFSLSYEFGAGGGPNGWNGSGDETMRTFLFTSSATPAVDADTVEADITELGGDDYDINRANDTNTMGDDQWTTRTVSTFYTATSADVGKTVYFGMEFLNDSGGLLFPRIDLINLTVDDGSGQAGDLDDDDDVDNVDFLIWQRGTPPDGQVLADILANYGTGFSAAPSVGVVPEPSSLLLLTLAATGLASTRRRVC